MMGRMSEPDVNQWGQPVGPPVPAWETRPWPAALTMDGRYCRLEPLDASAHADDLFRANSTDDGRMWTYLLAGPYADAGEYRTWLAGFAADPTLVPYAVIDGSGSATRGQAVGVAAYLRISPEHGTIEVGHLAFSPLLQRTVAATEAMALMMRHVFDDLGYRRYEWKCNALNAPSRRAAIRLGFAYEGTFRQALVTRGRNRDTAWYAMTDGDWALLRPAFATWLDPANFDAQGGQRQALSALTAAALAGGGLVQRNE
jgi:RimJ/RimL family protein N-acetyltransferase